MHLLLTHIIRRQVCTIVVKLLVEEAYDRTTGESGKERIEKGKVGPETRQKKPMIDKRLEKLQCV